MNTQTKFSKNLCDALCYNEQAEITNVLLLITPARNPSAKVDCIRLQKCRQIQNEQFGKSL